MRLFMWRDPILNSNHTTVINSLLATVIVLLVASCNFFEDAYPPPEPLPQTEILGVEILPNDTLAPGDTVTFRCVIEDSLDPRYEYSWALSGDEVSSINTDSNSIDWIAPSNSGRYDHRVIVDNGSEDSSSVYKEFEVFITE